MNDKRYKIVVFERPLMLREVKNNSCPRSYSKLHSFETDKWVVVGEVPKCSWCGFVLDSISLEAYTEQKKKMSKWITKWRSSYIKSLKK